MDVHARVGKSIKRPRLTLTYLMHTNLGICVYAFWCTPVFLHNLVREQGYTYMYVTHNKKLDIPVFIFVTCLMKHNLIFLKLQVVSCYCNRVEIIVLFHCVHCVVMVIIPFHS